MDNGNRVAILSRKKYFIVWGFLYTSIKFGNNNIIKMINYQIGVLNMKKLSSFMLLSLGLVCSFVMGCIVGNQMIGETKEVEKVRVESPAINYKFYLKSEDGIVIVYKTSTQEIYEYTNIVVEELPEDVKQEVLETKYILDEEELYTFLESYTS